MKKIASALIALAITIPAASPAFADPHKGPDQHHDNGRGNDKHGPDNHGKGPQGNPFRKGQRFDHNRAPNYRVVDYHQYRRLSPPPRGYHWVRSGSDALLVAISTGVIASVIANNF